jgi:hypothetical protein
VVKQAPARPCPWDGRFSGPRHHGRMDTPKQPASPQPTPDLQARVAKWLELKQEMEALHAQLEYARLMLKLGVVKR